TENVMMRPAALALVCFGLALGSVAGTASARHAATHSGRHSGATPLLDSQMWDKLAALPSYHIDSTLLQTRATTREVGVPWTEDAHGKDYHLVLHTSGLSTQNADIYFVKGHYYIGTAGKFADVGPAGETMSAAILAMTFKYWSALTRDSHDVHYVGR